MTRESVKRAALNYYYRNREKILQKKKERYINDNLYRERVKELSTESNKRRNELKKLMKNSEKLRKKYWRKFNVKGEVIEFCRINYLAKNIGRTTQTVRLWEKSGMLPKAVIYKNNRYYSKYQFELIVKFWEKYGKEDLYKFFNEVRKNWRLK